MKNNRLIDSINNNIEVIYNTLANIFNLDKDEYKTLIINLINYLKSNKKSYEEDVSIDILTSSNLENLKNALILLNLGDEEIKKAIVNSPIILFFSNRLDDIYYIFKRDYSGYIVLNKEGYDTFLITDNFNQKNKVYSKKKK